MSVNKIGLFLIFTITCCVFYFYKKNSPTIEEEIPTYSYQKENISFINTKPKAEKMTFCGCSATHICKSDVPKPIKASFQTSVFIPPSSEVAPKKNENVVVETTKKRPNRKQAFIPKSANKGHLTTEQPIKGKIVRVTLKGENTAKGGTVIEKNNLERYRRKSAFPYIDVMTCNSSRSKKYHEKMCSGIKRCSSSIDTLKAFEAGRQGFEPCKICFKYNEKIVVATQKRD